MGGSAAGPVLGAVFSPRFCVSITPFKLFITPLKLSYYPFKIPQLPLRSFSITPSKFASPQLQKGPALFFFFSLHYHWRAGAVEGVCRRRSFFFFFFFSLGRVLPEEVKKLCIATRHKHLHRYVSIYSTQVLLNSVQNVGDIPFSAPWSVSAAISTGRRPSECIC